MLRSVASPFRSINHDRSRTLNSRQIRASRTRPSDCFGGVGSNGRAIAMTKSFVIPTGAERSACPERSRREAERRDLFWCSDCTKRSLGCAALWAASLGMTGQMRWPCLQRGTSGVAEIAENKFYVAKSAAGGSRPRIPGYRALFDDGAKRRKPAETRFGAPLRWGSISGRAAKIGQFKSGKCFSSSSTLGSRRRRTAPAAICSRVAWR
jgi:hypothetical protein